MVCPVLWWPTQNMIQRLRTRGGDMLKTGIGRLRVLGWTEGVSYLALLGVAMPLKYLLDIPEGVRWVGLAHGILWILYVGALMTMYLARSWRVTLLLGGILASLLPFGPFVFDRYLPKDAESNSDEPATNDE